MSNIRNNRRPRIIAPFKCEKNNNRPRLLFEEIRYLLNKELRWSQYCRLYQHTPHQFPKSLAAGNYELTLLKVV